MQMGDRTRIMLGDETLCLDRGYLSMHQFTLERKENRNSSNQCLYNSIHTDQNTLLRMAIRIKANQTTLIQ